MEGRLVVGGIVTNAKNVNKKGENSLRVIGGQTGPAPLGRGAPLLPLRRQSLDLRTKCDRPAEGEHVCSF